MPKKYYMHYTYKPSKRRYKIIAILLVAALLLVGATLLVRHTYYDNLKAPSSANSIVEVVVPKGAGVKEISDLLFKNHLIKSPWAFKLYIHNQDAASVLQAGTYQLRPNMSVNEIVSVITHGKVVTNLVTIIPGQTLADVKKTLLGAGYSEAEVDDALNAENYTDVPILVDKPAGASLEGFLYPDSYQRDSGTAAKTIVTEALNEMQLHLTTDLRDKYAAQGLSTYQGLILASIIEKEVAHPNDKAQVAQVFLKRLHQNIMLGSDVTAFYGTALAGVSPSVSYDSPYNTRIHEGLPPTPIAAVSQSSLEAVANPANTDWLFFVAGDDGTTYFSRTVEEHDALVKQYCHKLCQ